MHHLCKRLALAAATIAADHHKQIEETLEVGNTMNNNCIAVVIFPMFFFFVFFFVRFHNYKAEPTNYSLLAEVWFR